MLAEVGSSSLERRTLKRSEFDDLDSTLSLWFTESRGENTPINETIMLSQAHVFANQFGYADFKGSSGSFQKVCIQGGSTLTPQRQYNIVTLVQIQCLRLLHAQRCNIFPYCTPRRYKIAHSILSLKLCLNRQSSLLHFAPNSKRQVVV